MSSTRPASRKFQPPKGTRDFYPQDMAVRRYLEGVWRKTSINHGFDEIEGPMFEDIELYKHKSGPGIVSEIFQVFSGKDKEELERIRGGGDAPFALRPEFTPTLARMVAAKAAELPRPIKWFAIPQHFRAERPQRGRLREFVQWNVDFIGDDSPKADAEVIATAVNALTELKFDPSMVKVRIGNRDAIRDTLLLFGLPPENLAQALQLFDKQHEMGLATLLDGLVALGLPHTNEFAVTRHFSHSFDVASLRNAMSDDTSNSTSLQSLCSLFEHLTNAGIGEWLIGDLNIVRGLAYYTGTVFEIHESTGAERAIAGGGRYDNLIESFGGPSLPACGFGMGDVVLANLLHDKGLLPEDVYMKPLRPHAFAIAASDEAEAKMRQVVAQLRRDGFHIRHSYKTTRNVGKLLGDANKSRSLSAIIFGKDLAENRVDFKDLQSGEQISISLDELPSKLKQAIDRNP